MVKIQKDNCHYSYKVFNVGVFVVNFLEVLKLLFFGFVVFKRDIEHDVETVFHFCLLLTTFRNLF